MFRSAVTEVLQQDTRFITTNFIIINFHIMHDIKINLLLRKRLY